MIYQTGQCCTTMAANGSPLMHPAHLNLPPSPVCEHVRDRDTQQRKNTKNQLSRKGNNKLENSESDDDKYPMAAHLTRFKETRDHKESCTFKAPLKVNTFL